MTGNATITFVTASVSGSLVTEEKPYVAQGSWLQVLVPNSFIDILESSLTFLNEPVMVNRFINYLTCWLFYFSMVYVHL